MVQVDSNRAAVPLRPVISSTVPPAAAELMQACWLHCAAARPSALDCVRHLTQVGCWESAGRQTSQVSCSTTFSH